MSVTYLSRATVAEKNASNKGLTPLELRQLNALASGTGYSDGLTRAPIRYFWGRHGHEVVENLIRDWNEPQLADVSVAHPSTHKPGDALPHRSNREYERHSGAQRGSDPPPAVYKAMLAVGMDQQDWVPRGKWPETLDMVADYGSNYRTTNIVQSTFDQAYRAPDHRLTPVDPALPKHNAVQMVNTVHRHKPSHAIHLLAYTPNRREEGHIIENFSSKGEKNYNAEQIIRSPGTLENRQEFSHQPDGTGGRYSTKRNPNMRSVHRGFYGTGQRAAVQMLK
jgi:hypothetical protein